MTRPSRRTLLRTGIVGSALALLAPSGYAAAATTADLYTRSRFKRLVTARFTLSTATASWPVTLDGLSDLPGAPPGAANAFRLSFTPSRGTPPQGTYTLSRKGFTATPLFVVPGDPARGHLDAVVNRTV